MWLYAGKKESYMWLVQMRVMVTCNNNPYSLGVAYHPRRANIIAALAWL
jgi:hypothetical protein